MRVCVCICAISMYTFRHVWYSCISNIEDALFHKCTQSIVHSVTNKHNAYSPLECTIIVYISMYTYRI